MKRALLIAWGLCAAFFDLAAAEPKSNPKDTVVPNAFWFSTRDYTVPPGATTVEISVSFAPGNRGYTGSVGYYTEDDTARDGIHYQGVSGQLYFSGINLLTFEIPISPASTYEEPKSFRVVLTNDAANIWYGPATVVIEYAPRLECTRQGASLLLLWPGACQGYVLEGSTRADFEDAAEVVASPVLMDDRWQLEQLRHGPARFYRLRKS
jgi:hypothetical protein